MIVNNHFLLYNNIIEKEKNENDQEEVLKKIVYLIERAAVVAISRAFAASLTLFTLPTVWTHVSSRQGQGDPADHNPLLHLHKRKIKETPETWRITLFFSLNATETHYFIYIKKSIKIFASVLFHTFAFFSEKNLNVYKKTDT